CVRERGVEALRDRVEHARIGLAAGGLGLIRVGTVEHRFDAPPGLVHRAVHLRVYRVQGGHVEQPAAYPRLVGRDHDAPAVLGEPRDRVEAARDRPPLVGVLDVLVAVVIDDAVAVEDDELHFSTASLEMSATRFMASRSSRKRASRLLRSFLSSTITITLSKKLSTGSFSIEKLFR